MLQCGLGRGVAGVPRGGQHAVRAGRRRRERLPGSAKPRRLPPRRRRPARREGFSCPGSGPHRGHGDVGWYTPVGQVSDLFLEVPPGGAAIFAELLDSRPIHRCCCPQRAGLLTSGAFAEEVADLLRDGFVEGLRRPSGRHQDQKSWLGCPLLDCRGEAIEVVVFGEVRPPVLVHHGGLPTALAGQDVLKNAEDVVLGLRIRAGAGAAEVCRGRTRGPEPSCNRGQAGFHDAHLVGRERTAPGRWHLS